MTNMDDLEKHILEQAKIEVEHTRSWPTKVLAFYVAINAGVVTALFSLSDRKSEPLVIPNCAKSLITSAVVVMFIWVMAVLIKNHLSYLRHRNMQIQIQAKCSDKLKAIFEMPKEWEQLNEVSLATRWSGWGFYAYLAVLVTSLSLVGVWVS